MNYIEHLSEPWFTEINEGRKTIEGRKNKGRFANMKVGETIEWYNEDKRCCSRITNVRQYDTFKNYLLSEGLSNCLPMIENIEDGVNVYYQYYTKEDEKMYGVVAIEIELIEEIKERRERERDSFILELRENAVREREKNERKIRERELREREMSEKGLKKKCVIC